MYLSKMARMWDGASSARVVMTMGVGMVDSDELCMVVDDACDDDVAADGSTMCL